MRRLGRRRRAAACVVERHADRETFFAERDERDAAHLHDHADPGGRGLHDGRDGLHRHPGRAGGVGAGRTSRPACSRVSHHHVHHSRCLIDGISMIVLTAVIVLPMVKHAGLRSRLVRRLSRDPRRDGADHAAGRLQPVRAAEHERARILPSRARRFRSSCCWCRGLHHHRISADRAVPAEARFSRLSELRFKAKQATISPMNRYRSSLAGARRRSRRARGAAGLGADQMESAGRLSGRQSALGKSRRVRQGRRGRDRRQAGDHGSSERLAVQGAGHQARGRDRPGADGRGAALDPRERGSDLRHRRGAVPRDQLSGRR